MMREYHVKFYEGLRGKFPRATLLVIVCEDVGDAERILVALLKRMERFGLSIHPDKSKLVDRRSRTCGKGPRSFDFLGFTFYWGKSRNKKPLIRVKSAKDRFSRSCHRLWELCRTIQHWHIEEQVKRINSSLRGHYNYYGVSFNQRAVWSFRYYAYFYWRYWLNRRSQKRTMSWEKFAKIKAKYPLAQPRKMIPLWN